MCPRQAPEQTFKGPMVAPEIQSSAEPREWGAWPAFQLLPSSPSFPTPCSLHFGRRLCSVWPPGFPEHCPRTRPETHHLLSVYLSQAQF